MKILRLWWLGALSVVGALALSGCEQEESNDLAKAQACLDRVTTVTTDADACFQYIEKYNSQQANILKCSIKFVAGGLTSSRIAQAYTNLSEPTFGGSGSTREAALMATLALTPASKADEAKTYCDQSQVPGLMYLANLSVIGSVMASVAAPSSIAAPTPAEVASMIDALEPGGSASPSERAAVGQAVLTLGSSYCGSSTADDEVCSDINAAVASGGGDPVAVSNHLFCLTQGKTFNGTVCVP